MSSTQRRQMPAPRVCYWWWKRRFFFLITSAGLFALVLGGDVNQIMNASTTGTLTRSSSSLLLPPPPQSISIGVYYYAWYETPQNWRGYLREKLQHPQKPWLGEYNNVHSQTVIDQHLKWAHQYNISHVICSWWGRESSTDYALKHHLTRAARLNNLTFALLLESKGIFRDFIHTDPHTGATTIWFDDNKAEHILLEEIYYMEETYFHHPNYLLVDGKRVVYLYLTRIYRGAYEHAFAQVREILYLQFGIELYLVGDEVWWNTPNADRIRPWNAITAYNMHGPAQYAGYPNDTHFLDHVEAMYTKYQALAKSHGVALIPGIAPAFNDRGTRLQDNHYAIPHETSADLADSGQYTTLWEGLHMAARVLEQGSRHLLKTATATATVVPSSTIMITSWNEWHEDTSIEPTVECVSPSKDPVLYTQGYTYRAYGFELLKVVQKFVHETQQQSNDDLDILSSA